MKLTVTEIAVHNEDENPIYGENVTRVRLEDIGGGFFVKLIQDDQEVCLNFEEIAFIKKAIEQLVYASSHNSC